MFRVECLVDDKMLAYVLHALATAKAANVISVPVNNIAVGADGQLMERTSGEVTEMLRAWCADKNLTHVTAPIVRQFQMEVGRAQSGYSNTIARAVDKGVLKKRKGAKAGYDVTPAKANSK